MTERYQGELLSADAVESTVGESWLLPTLNELINEVYASVPELIIHKLQSLLS